MSQTPTALVRLIDDDADLLAATRQSLKIAGFTVEAFSDPLAALAGLGPDYPGVVLSDVRMPGLDGIALFGRLRALDPELPVILMTGHGEVEMAVAAMREGAWDFLSKPVGLDALTAALRRAASARALVMENRRLRAESRESQPQDALAGVSPAMSAIRAALPRLAEAGIDLLITGPSGAGKSALARAIHDAGPRRSKGFVHIACDALGEGEFAADLFGIEPQAGQLRQHGRIERADRGILFLDRIEQLSPAMQARLLHVIEHGAYRPLGAAGDRQIDMQVIAATTADLAQAVQEGRFNADLYYRLSGVTLHMPALAERRADITVLYRNFLIEAARAHKRPLPEMTAQVQARLDTHDWPGNARELRQFAQSQILGLDLATGTPESDTGATLAERVARYEAGLLREALAETKGQVAKTIDRLGLPRKTFYDKLARHGITPEDYREKG